MRLLLASVLAVTAIVLPSQEADACTESGCQTLVASNARPLPPQPTVAPAAAESEVRARDLAKLQPQTPEFWLHFKSYAYKKLPTHQDKSFKAVWIAMAVQTPDETVAAVGLQGIWW
jgi:hypothetical protein